MKLPALLVLVACTPKPAEPLETLTARHKPQPRKIAPSFASAARPDIDVSRFVPDLHDELRWPLTVARHPVLAPQFPIARELADPGIEWTALCTGPVLARHVVGTNANDLMEYLRGWCAALAHDPDRALGHFARVRGSVVNGLAAALVYDVSFVLADESADVAEQLLQKHGLQDVAILDTLAATYVEIGRDHDGWQINRRAIAFASKQPPASCHRTAREVLLGNNYDAFVLAPRTAQGVCGDLQHALECAVVHRCIEYVQDLKGTKEQGALVSAYLSWPSGRGSFDEWKRVADYAWKALPVEGASKIGRAALAMMLDTTSCEKQELEWVRHLATFFDPEMKLFDLGWCLGVRR